MSETTMTDDDLVQQVRETVASMCAGDRWRMCIPAQTDDSDVLIAELADRFDRLRATTTPTGKMTEAEIERRHLIADVVGVARWLADDPGYTRAMATRDLRRIGQKYNQGVWSDGELAQLSGLRPTPEGPQE